MTLDGHGVVFLKIVDIHVSEVGGYVSLKDEEGRKGQGSIPNRSLTLHLQCTYASLTSGHHIYDSAHSIVH